MKKHFNFLLPGDVVDVIAPASHAPADKLRAGLEWLSDQGLMPRVQANLIKPSDFFASDLETQLDQLRSALYSDSKLIWCLRGGYGSMRLIPHIKKWKKPKTKKMFLGFSDVTSLHLFFNQEWNWPTLHGRVLSQMAREHRGDDREELKKFLLGELTTPLTFRNLIPLNDHARKKTIIEGKIIGGNLRMLQSSLGTPIELKARNRILFMEDIGERGYSIDRMLEQMIQSKILDRGLKALVFGDFTEGLEKDGKDLTSVAFRRIAERVPYPVFSGLPCGHGEVNRVLPFLTQAQIHPGKKTLKILF
jgi:muramoyltetrapeptide carboxypeptidase